jgi:hypothetical protein
MNRLRRYFESIARGKITLWCYLIWYLVTVAHHFDADPRIWLNAMGIAVVVGCGLMLSVARPASGNMDPWQSSRLLLIPFCVSSFSSLIKGKGFILVFSPDAGELAAAVLACAGFVVAVALVKRARVIR